MCLIQELCLYIYNFKKYAKKSKGLLPLLYTNVVLSFAMLLQFRETDPRVHEVTPELHPAPQFWATTSLHINSAILNRPKTTVFSLSLSQHSFSHSIIISLPNRFPGKGLLNTANSQSNALLAPWTETTTNCANGHSMGDKRAYPPPPPSTHTFLLKYRKQRFHDPLFSYTLCHCACYSRMPLMLVWSPWHLSRTLPHKTEEHQETEEKGLTQSAIRRTSPLHGNWSEDWTGHENEGNMHIFPSAGFTWLLSHQYLPRRNTFLLQIGIPRQGASMLVFSSLDRKTSPHHLILHYTVHPCSWPHCCWARKGSAFGCFHDFHVEFLTNGTGNCTKIKPDFFLHFTTSHEAASLWLPWKKSLSNLRGIVCPKRDSS